MNLTRSELNFLFFLNITDSGNMERAAKMLGDDWRFVWQEKCWRHYNGKVWEKTSELALVKPVIACFRYLRALKFTEEEKKQNY